MKYIIKKQKKILYCNLYNLYKNIKNFDFDYYLIIIIQ